MCRVTHVWALGTSACEVGHGEDGNGEDCDGDDDDGDDDDGDRSGGGRSDGDGREDVDEVGCLHYLRGGFFCRGQDSIGGNSKTFIVANVSPADDCMGETLSALKFAQRAKMVKVLAV